MLDALPRAALALAQKGLDAALAWPRWTAFALLGFALALTLLGRHGQRLLAGAFLGGVVAGVALLFIRPQLPDSSWPGLLAVIGGGAAFALGLGVPGWTTALASSVSLGALFGYAGVEAGKLPWLAGALPGALLGLFLGLANHLWWGLWMPPLAAALGIALASAGLLGPHGEGAMVPQLISAQWALALFGALAVALLAVSFEREHLRKKRLGAKNKALADEELKSKLKRDRERHDKYLGKKSSPT